ncbi:transcriptional regulator [Chelatococcus reniformis]|uniref:Transcriptional regulator n=1 Tax=Chelatococcus reniformis TaxID=1494448 RepID=A0A916XQ13_9HYPH|nr:transcriptional regulator [Chelatococcus reniformis]
MLALARSRKAMTLKDLAREAGMTPAKAHPYLVSFGRLRIVEQDPDSGRYDLGPQALHIGLAALQRLDPLRIANEEVRKLCSGADHSGAISVWGNLGPAAVSVIEADYPLHVVLRPGTVLSLSTTATGRVFAAYMPRSVVRAALKFESHRFGGQQHPPSLSALERDVSEVRRLGVASNVGATTPGVIALGAPAFEQDGTVALAIALVKPGAASDAKPEGDLARKVIACAQRISERLGYRPAPQQDSL